MVITCVTQRWHRKASRWKTSFLINSLVFNVSQTTFGFLQGGKPVDPTELEAFLDEYLVSNFATEADDESPYEVIS